MVTAAPRLAVHQLESSPLVMAAMEVRLNSLRQLQRPARIAAMIAGPTQAQH
jgi:hypothetical protein